MEGAEGQGLWRRARAREWGLGGRDSRVNKQGVGVQGSVNAQHTDQMGNHCKHSGSDWWGLEASVGKAAALHNVRAVDCSFSSYP